MLKAENIVKHYGELAVLKGVDITINAGEIVAIVGSSGAGKSTLLHILGTLDKPTSGNIWLNNTPLHSLEGKKLAQFRNEQMGFVFQFHHLLPEFTAIENVCMPALIAGKRKNDLIKKEALALLDLLGLANRATHKPNALSGGEQQRIAVARALINKPAIVFADEPTGNLDSVRAQELHALFVHLKQSLGQTFLIVTHNEELAAMSDRVLHMKDGLMLAPEIT